jgi:hypothetical protein
MAEKSDFRSKISDYVAQGLSEEEATKQAFLDAAVQIGWDFVGGMATGGIMGGGASAIEGVINTHTQNKETKDTYESFLSDLLNESLEINPDNELAKKIQAKLDKGKNISGSQIRNLVESNESTVRGQDTDLIQKATISRLTELGESGDVETLASTLTKQASGGKLNKADQQTISNSKYGQRVSNELNVDNIRSGEYSSAWAEKIGTNKLNAEEYGRLLEEAQATEESGADVVDNSQGIEIKDLRRDASVSSPKAETPKMSTTESDKITIERDGEEVEVKVSEIASVEDGELMLKLEDGEVVSADEVNYGATGVALVYNAASDMASRVGGFNTDTANLFVKGFDPNGGLTASEYVHGFSDAYRFGTLGYPVSELASGVYTSKLNEKQRNTAYNLGKVFGNDEVASKQAKITSIGTINTNKNANKISKGAKGRLYFDGKTVGKSLTERQKASLKTLRYVAEGLGVNIHVFESPVGKDGKRQGANGWFDPSDNSIHIDLYAGNNGDSLMLFTAAHELTHFIKKWSPAKFKTFADFLLEQYGEHGHSVEALIQAKLDALEKNGRIKSGMTEKQAYDLAYEEVVADSCEAMLTDSNAIEKIAELRAKDQTLWEKIKEFIDKLVERIKAAYEGLDTDSIEAQYVRDMKDSAEKLQALWTEALIEASENYNSIGSRNLEDFAEAKNENGEPLFQYRAMEADEETYKEMLRKWGKMSDVQIDNLFATVDKAMDLIKDNLEVLDYAWEADIDDRAFSPVKPNSDKLYQVSLDFSTLCRKRILQQTIAAQLQEALNKPLSKEEGIAIRDALIALQEEGRQIEVACALCYVESARMKSPEQIKRFIENREAIIKEFFAGKSGGDIKAKINKAEEDAREKLHRENPNGIKGKDGETMLDPRTAKLNTLPKKYADEIRSAKKSAKKSYVPTAEEQRIIEVARDMTVSDFTSPEGLENLAKHYPSLFDAYTSYIRNATKSKGIENDTWWRAGDSMQIGDVLIANMNRENGLRSQSWSDFQVVHILDYIASTIELATRETKEQAYTKVPDYVELMGKTGVMINLSLIPTAKFNGTLDYDSIEGMDYKRALELRDKYHATAGTICIGVDNEQIKMLLADATIDYVIPYHKSGMSAAIRKLMHIPTWSQYEEYQSEKTLSRAEAQKQAEKYGVKLLPEGDPNYHKNTSFSEWFDLKEAQQIAKMENSNPTDKTSQEKYGVMYGGYKAMQNAANNYLKLCAERGISPKFSHEKANFTAEENYWKLLIDRKMVDNVTGDVIEQQTIKPIFDENEIMRILNDELDRYPNVKADQDYAIRKVTEGMLSGSIKGGMSAKDIAKVMQTPVDNVTTTNIIAAALEIREFDSSEERLTQNIRDVADMSSVYDVDKSKLEKTGKRPSDIFEEYFKNWGYRLHSDELGDIKVERSSIKSEIRHGITAEKIASIEAIPTVVNEGKVIFVGLKPNSDVQRIVVCAPIKIGGTPYYMGVMLQRDTQTQRLYLHNVVIEKEASDISQADLLTTGADENNEYLFVTSILQKALTVKYKNNDTRLYSDRSSYAPTFYSYMGKVVDEIKLEKMSTGGVVPYLKGKGVKNEEIKWSGIETFLEGKKSVTKAELQEFVAGSQLQIEEEMSDTESFDIVQDGIDYIVKDKKGNILDKWEWTQAPDDPDLQGWMSEGKGDIVSSLEELREYTSDWYGSDSTRWSQYRLDGGTNYRELVFKMPNSSYNNRAMKAHWGQDVEGVLAHARVQDMTTADGKKMLFIEELQSDWHNEGHQKGYVTKEYEDAVEVYDKLAEDYANKRRAFNKYVRSGEFRSDPDEVSKKKFDWLRRKMDEAEKRMQDADRDINSLKEKGMGDVPDAPFQNTYHEYVIKRLLRMAAEEGYDSIGWTPSHIQSERWSEEFAEAYRIEYDQDIPKFLRKYGKKWGATVGKTSFEGNGEVTYKSDDGEKYGSIRERFDDMEDAVALVHGDQIKGNLTVVEKGNLLILQNKTTGDVYSELQVNEGGVDVWSMDIPDSMKDSVLYEGQVMYSDRDPDSVSNRSLLANALESVAQNDIERNKLKEYKGKIALIEAEQAKLSELRGKIKDLSFAKGPRDTEAIRSLQFEANQAANRINTYDRQLLNLESTKALKGVLEREKQMAYKKAEQRGKEALARYKEKAAETEKVLMNRYQESRKRGVESRHKTEMRHKIKNVVNELNQYLLKGTKDKHVPIGLQKAVAEALEAVNMDTVGAKERIAKLEQELMKAKSPEMIQEISKRIDHIKEMGDRMDNKLQSLKASYDDFVNSDDPLIAGSHDEVISNSISKVIKEVGSTPLRDMSLNQLESVYDLYKMVLFSVRNANKAFKAAKNEEISVIANRVMEEIDNLGQKKLYQTKAGQLASKFDWNNLKPVYAFERIGSNTFTEVFKSVRAGEDTWAEDITEAKEFSTKQREKFNYKSWDFKKRYGFTSTSGMKFELSLDQIMSLYAYSKRDQARDHLRKGGIVFDETTEVTMKTKLGIPVKFNPTQATAYNISDETLADIISKLTPDQKGFVDIMQDYLSTVMGAKGNEVSLELYGVKLYKEKNYFPLKSATQFMAKAKEQQKGEVKVKNSGFSKETVAKANNPIVLTPFMDVWADHVNDMSMYHAFVLPLEDFYRVYNYKTPTSDTMATESVEMYLQNAYGKAATQYIDQLLKDLNGGARSDSTAGVINKLTGLFKKSAVFASLSVVIQQPSAIARATALVDSKNFVGLPSGKHSETWAEVKKYAPIAIIKEMGYFDVGMGQSTVEWIKNEKTWKDKVDDVASKAPALADELAWCSIWKAIKRETAVKKPELKTNSEEFLKLVGERFTEVITKTQVYDSVLSRSANMRSKDTGMKMATAFMGEPTTSLNMLENALTQAKRGDKKKAAKAIGGVISSMVLNSILVSFVYAGRDDDEDKTYLEKYLSTLTEELIDSINPLTLIPFVKDVVSIMQGYDVERSDMAIITDLIDAWNNLEKEKRSTYRKVEDFAGAIASIFGLPVKNVMRDVRGIYNTINSFVNGEDTTGAGVKVSLKEALTGDDITNGQQLYEAILNEDKAQIERVKSRFKDQKAIDSAINKALRENDPRIKEAAEAKYNGDIAEYMRVAKEIIAEGYFKQDNIVSAINSEINALEKEDGATSSSGSSKFKSLYEMSDYYTTIRKNDTLTANSIKADIINTDIKNGKTKEEAEKSFKTKLTSEIKDKHSESKLTDVEAKNLLVKYNGMSQKDAVAKVQYWSFQKNYPDYDLSESAVGKYYEYVKPSGIGAKTYYDYYKEKSKCIGTDSNGDGRADAGTVKAEILALIDSLPLTSAQKDALYFAEGSWKEELVNEAPWH